LEDFPAAKDLLKELGSGSNQRDNIISLDGQIKMSTLSK
jgi:hypothetical protein